MSDDDLCVVQITAPDEDWLVEFTRRLVIDRLAASAHNEGPIRSIYQWQGELYDRSEFKASLHTRDVRVPAIIQRLDAEHPYAVPGVVAMAITRTSPSYSAWVVAQTEKR
jgi:periplasmic divalent cation tolerance protein